MIERGRIDGMTIRTLRAVARQLDAELDVTLRWRGGDLDRLTDEGHARLVGRAARLLESRGWDVRPEVSYSVFGERGSIDLLAWHAVAASLMVVEVKTEIASVEETLRRHDVKTRLASAIASDRFGWGPRRVSRMLVLPGLSTPRRRIARHSAVFDRVYPARGAALIAAIAAPTESVSGVLFLGETGSPRRGVSRKRLRTPRNAMS